MGANAWHVRRASEHTTYVSAKHVARLLQDRSAEKLALSSILGPGRQERTTIVVAHRLQTVSKALQKLLTGFKDVLSCIMHVWSTAQILRTQGWCPGLHCL